MKLKLSTKDRMDLLAILPRQGSLIHLRLVRETENLLSFGKSEIEALNFKPAGEGLVQWDPKADKPKIVDMPAPVLQLLLNNMDQLAKDEKLAIEYLDIYERLMAVK